MSERVAWGFPLPAPGGSAPDLERFRALAPGRRVIPVVRRLLADGETPVGLYRKLAEERPGTFLLESAEHGRAYSRYSFVGARCRAMLTEVDGAATWWGDPPYDVPQGGDPLDALRRTIEVFHTDRAEGLPPLTGGMVGYLSYDGVRRWERVPDDNPDELHIPELGSSSRRTLPSSTMRTARSSSSQMRSTWTTAMSEWTRPGTTPWRDSIA
jgi:anthranilate synthase component 1